MSFTHVIGCVVISKKGHDKGQAYVITSVIDDKHVFVANGENRQVSCPKRKNICHLDITKERTAATNDLEIKKTLKKFYQKERVSS